MRIEKYSLVCYVECICDLVKNSFNGLVREEAKLNCSVLTDKRELETLVADNICIYGNQSFLF